MNNLAVKAFGDLRFRNGEAHCRVSTRKTAALAVYLAMHPGRPFSRDSIAGLLWGDKNDTNARHSLSQAISDIRRGLGTDLVCTDPQFLWCRPGAADVDALEIEQRAKLHPTQEDLEAIERLYDGEFLHGFELGDEAFQSWVLAERERLREVAHRALGELLRLRIHNAEYGAALGTARRMLELDPFDEDVHRAIMTCLARQGSGHRALAHYQVLRADLRRDLDVEPEPGTTELSREIMRGTSGSKQKTLADYAFILEQLPYAVTITDPANRIVGWNRIAEETLGYSKAEMFGRSPTSLYAPDSDSALADKILRKAIAGGRWMGDVTLKTKDGSTCRQRRVVAPLFGPEGLIIGAFGHGFAV